MGYNKNELDDIVLLNNELTRESEQSKTSYLDIRARLKNGEQVNIEIQVLNLNNMVERSIFYWSRLFYSQLKRSEDYAGLEKFISIIIVDFDITESDDMHSIYHLTEDRQGYRLSDVLEIHFIELSKLNHKDEGIDCKLIKDCIIEGLAIGTCYATAFRRSQAYFANAKSFL